MRTSRPLGITIVSVIYMVGGAFSVLGGIIRLIPGLFLILCSPGIFAGGIWSLFTGLLNLGFGAALWTGRRWAYAVVVIFAVINIALSVLGALSGEGLPLFNILWNLFVIWYMQTPGVKEYFGEEPPKVKVV